MVMKETVQSLRAYVGVSAGLGAIGPLEGLFASDNNVIGIVFSLVGLGFCISWIYLSYALPNLLVKSPRTVRTIILAATGWAVLVSLLSLLAGDRGGIFVLVIAILLGWYLLKNVKRLSTEALEWAGPTKGGAKSLQKFIQHAVAYVVAPTCLVGAMYAFAYLMRVKATEWAASQVDLTLLDRLLLVAGRFWLALSVLMVGAWWLFIRVTHPES